LSFDRDLLRQVLVNLCDNSSQALAAASGGEAAANGGAAVRGTVTFTLTPDGRPGRGGATGWRDRTSSSVVALEVADDGPGIPGAVLPRLFEPYATTRRVGEGMGLGLAISRKILLDHGGDLELARTSAAGSVFRLLLPCDQEASS
jgi:signal transduction histidine kinase